MRRTRLSFLTAALTAVALMATGCVFIPSGAGGTDTIEQPADDVAGSPQNMAVGGVTYTADGVLLSDAAPTLAAPPDSDGIEVAVVFDAMCPHCAQFEVTYGQTLHELVDRGDITLTAYPVAFVAQDASQRSANAFMAVASLHPQSVKGFQELLMVGNLGSQGAGLDADELIEAAAAAGASSPELETAIREESYADWVDIVHSGLMGQNFPGTDVAVTSTPFVVADGQPIEPDTFAGTADEALERLRDHLR